MPLRSSRAIAQPDIFIPKEVALDFLNMLHVCCPWLECGLENLDESRNTDINLDGFRFYARRINLHLILCHTYAINPNVVNMDFSPWLSCEKKSIAPIVINRTLRNMSKDFPWETLKNKDCVFVGLKEEHKSFPIPIPYYQTSSILDLAQVISGAKCIICNQSFSWTIAEAMDKPRCLEVFPSHPCAMPITSKGFINKDGLEKILSEIE